MLRLTPQERIGVVIDARDRFRPVTADERTLGCWARGMFLDSTHTAGQTDDRPCDTEAPRDEP